MTKESIIKFAKVVLGMLLLSLAIAIIIPDESVAIKYIALLCFVYGIRLVNRNL